MSSKPPAPTVQAQTSEVKLPAWVDAAGQANYNFATDVAARPFMEYNNPRVAGLSDLERVIAPNIIQGAEGTVQGGQQTALDAARGATGFQAGRIDAPTGVDAVKAGSWLSQDIGAYMDPNLQNVINPTLDNMRRAHVLNEQRAVDATRASGVDPRRASRFAVGEAVRASENTRNMAATEAALRSQAFESAAGRAGGDIQTALQAALANQQSGLTTQGQRIQAQTADAASRAQGAGIQLQGGQLAANTGNAAGQLALQNAGFMAGLGATERGVAQAGLDTRYQEFMRKQSEGESDLNMRLQALGMTPYGKTTTGTTTTTTPTTTNPWMMGIGAASTLLPMFFSDRKTKKNIKRTGKLPGSDVNTYEFQYKDKFGGGPKQIGFMADDVERKVPGAVKKTKVDGKVVKMVDYGKVARDGRDDKGKLRGRYKPRLRGAFMAA